MIRVRVPGAIFRRAAYVVNWILSDRLGLGQPSIESHEIPEIHIIGDDGRVLICRCTGGWYPAGTSGGAFGAPYDKVSGLHIESDGAHDLADLPVWFGVPGEDIAGDTITVDFDLFGTIFWYLARVEELETDRRDIHGCFAASQSFVWKHDLLMRPVVDEYVDHLWSLMARHWPAMRRKHRQATLTFTCDVDVPVSRSLKNTRAAILVLGADFLRRRSLRDAAQTIENIGRAKLFGDYSKDPNNTFDWIMNRCEERGRKVTFFFIPGNPRPDIDDRYELSDPFVKKTIATILERQHLIGMHASYCTYQDEYLLRAELENLKAVCGAFGRETAAWQSRQHYLRWDVRQTPDLLAKLGIVADSTLGYADHVGFRCGTSHSFPLWSWQAEAPLPIVERPLIAMEGAALSEAAMNLGHETAVKVMLDLKRKCERFGGDFIFLWHNSELRRTRDREALIQLLDG